MNIDSQLQVLLSMLYFVAFILFQVLAIYFLVMNSKSKDNRLVFVMFSALCLWAIGLSITTFSKDAQEAGIWAKVAGVGWCTYFAVLLQFILGYTGNRYYHKLKYLIYLVPFIVYAVMYYGNAEHLVVATKYGYSAKAYVNIANLGFLDYLYQVYYTLCNVVMIVLLYRHEKNAKYTKIQNRTKNLRVGISVAFFAGLAINVFRVVFQLEIPAITIFMSFAVAAAFLYNHRHYNFLCKVVSLTMSKTKQIEPDIQRRIGIANLYIILSNAIYFVVYYYYRVSNNWLILFTVITISTTLYFVYLSEISDFNKNLLSGIMISVSIVFGSYLLDSLGALTTWAFGFSVLLVMLTYDSTRKIWFIIISVFAAQLIVVFQRYGDYVYYTNGDYLLRTFFSMAMVYVALFIRQRISVEDTQNLNHLKFQEIITELSEEGIESVDESANNLIREILNVTSSFFDADRGYVMVKGKDNVLRSIFFWSGDGRECSLTVNPEMYNLIEKDEFVYVRDVRSLPLEHELLLKSVFGTNVLSVLAIPIYKENELIAMLCCESAHRMKYVITDIINTLSNTITSMFEKAEKENTILTYAYYDSSTGLPNRNMFTKRLEEELNTIAEKKKEDASASAQIAVVFIGFEFHKRISGSTGQDISEQHLAVIGRRISNIGEGKHLLARFGNDNLIMLLRDYGDLNKVIEKMNAEVEEPIAADGSVITVSLMIGASVYPDDGDTVRTLVKNADMALYEARRRGSSTFVRYSSELASKFEERIVLTNSLYRAIENNELALFYQPQVNAQTQKIEGVEALIRWFHPEKGMISPGLFIPIAEETGMITSIGRWVLEQACIQANLWKKKYGIDLLMAVNVSTRQLQDGALSKVVESILKKHSVNAENLEVEVTESEQMTTQHQAIDNLQRLRDLGVRIAIDDFGTKHSSLARLRHLPITKLKIDMNFVRALYESEKSNSLVKSIIRLGKNLDLTVLAEGVETIEQYEFLRDHFCDEIQGYYFYKPMRSEEIDALLSRQLEMEMEKIDG